jgi:RNA-directed DNA polymerase
VRTFLEKARGVVRDNKGTTAGKLILQLNPMIKGWAMYHQHIVSKVAFTDVDNALYLALWRWARRRHPKKNHQWIRRKYFHPVEERNWVFTGTVPGKGGTTRTVMLFKAALLPIKRHAKIQGEANPYDPRWELYFEKRLGVKMEESLVLKGRKGSTIRSVRCRST